MKRAVAVLLPLLLTAPDFAQPRPPAKEPTGWTPHLMMQVREITSVLPSPDGKRVAFAVRRAVIEGNTSEYRTQIHIANADGTGAFELTHGPKSSEDPQWSPDGQTVAFVSDRSGKRNLWLIAMRGGEAWRLTDVKTGVSHFKWSPDGKHIAFTAADPPTPDEKKKAKEKDDARVIDEQPRRERLYVVPTARNAGGPRRLTAGDYSVTNFGQAAAPFDWSPDGKTIAFEHAPTTKLEDWTLADISVIDVASGTVKPLAATGAAQLSPHYSPDGRWVAFLKSDLPATWGFNKTIQVVPAAGGEPRELAETADRWPRLVGWSADGKQIYYAESHGTSNRLCAVPPDGPPVVVSDRPGVMGTTADPRVRLNATRTAVGFSHQTSDEPPEAFVSRLDRFAPVKVSAVSAGLPKLALGRTEVRRWKAADGREIEGLLTLPVNYEPGKRYPLLLIIHGGPMGVWGQTFLAEPTRYPVAAFAARGYAVLRGNPRGSSGYGKAFRYANFKDWGGGDYRDLMAGVDEMVRLGIADEGRLGVMGWSYGGYMTAWTITQTQRFKAASVGAAVINLTSFTATTDIPSFVPGYFGAEPWEVPELYRKHSPIFHVKGVRTPTLIQHGEADDRVPIGQGYELYNALKRQGCPVQMVAYPRTPHLANEPRLVLDIMRRNVAWFDRHVPAASTSAKRNESP
jgi:dipeptidyl aminopeptidase/acylaminoacyl peptidase